MATGLTKPCSVSHLYGGWLRGFSKELKPLLLLGAAATCWSLWLSRNDIVYEKKKNMFFECKYLPLLLHGATATCWTLWLSRNDIVFEKKKKHVL